MTWKFWKNEEDPDPVMEKVLTDLREYDTSSPEFATNMDYLERLTKLKTDTRRKLKVSPDTMFQGLVTFGSILLIIGYEQHHPLTTKAMNYVKPNNQKTSN